MTDKLPAVKEMELVLMTRTAEVVPGGILVPGGTGRKWNPIVLPEASRSAVTGKIPAVPFTKPLPATDPPSERNATAVAKPVKLVAVMRTNAVADAASSATW